MHIKFDFRTPKPTSKNVDFGMNLAHGHWALQFYFQKILGGLKINMIFLISTDLYFTSEDITTYIGREIQSEILDMGS